MNNWKTGLAIVATLFALTGGIAAALDYFARDSDLQLVADRLDQKIRNDQVYDIQQQLWQLEDRNPGVPVCDWPAHERDRYRKLKLRLEQLQQGGDG